MTHQYGLLYEYQLLVGWKALGILKKVESTRSANHCNDLFFL